MNYQDAEYPHIESLISKADNKNGSMVCTFACGTTDRDRTYTRLVEAMAAAYRGEHDQAHQLVKAVLEGPKNTLESYVTGYAGIVQQIEDLLK